MLTSNISMSHRPAACGGMLIDLGQHDACAQACAGTLQQASAYDPTTQ